MFIFGDNRLPASFWNKLLVVESGCWIWCFAPNKDGYSANQTYSSLLGRKTSAHRVTYAEANGGIPSGMEIDHLCRVRLCCNPAHLEAVTHAENCRRGLVCDVAKEVSSRKTHCVRGHDWLENKIPGGLGQRNTCRICKQIRNEENKVRLAKKWAEDPSYRERHKALARARYAFQKIGIVRP